VLSEILPLFQLGGPLRRAALQRGAADMSPGCEDVAIDIGQDQPIRAGRCGVARKTGPLVRHPRGGTFQPGLPEHTIPAPAKWSDACAGDAPSEAARAAETIAAFLAERAALPNSP
jgi:hypothetical protein